MKKILLASTMLASVAGFAAAEVAVSGSARMGVVNGYNEDSDKNVTTFSSQVIATFTGSGTTDGGLAFGGSFDMNNAVEAEDGTSGSTYISGAFGKIAMGGVDSGDKAAVGQLSSVGYEGLGTTNEISYAADGGLTDTAFDTYIEKGAGSKVLYTYSAGALAVSASSGQLSNGAHNHQAYGLGVAYTTGALTLAVGYGTSEIEGVDIPLTLEDYAGGTGSITDISASVSYEMGDTTIKAIYQDKSVDASYESEDYNLGSAVSMGASVDHKIDAVTLTAFAISTSVTSDLGGIDISLNRMGLGASYDLGGGAKFQAGWADAEVMVSDTEAASHSGFDAGVNFSF